MSIRVEHELHSRRRGRNVGVGLMLGAFVLLVIVLTFVKITQTDFSKAISTTVPDPALSATQGAAAQGGTD